MISFSKSISFFFWITKMKIIHLTLPHSFPNATIHYHTVTRPVSPSSWKIKCIFIHFLYQLFVHFVSLCIGKLYLYNFLVDRPACLPKEICFLVLVLQQQMLLDFILHLHSNLNHSELFRMMIFFFYITHF